PHARTAPYPLSLHDALPIYARRSPAGDPGRGARMSVRFRYRAATPDGQVVEGLVQAPSRQALLEQLRHQHLYPVTVDEATSAPGDRKSTRLNSSHRTISYAV